MVAPLELGLAVGSGHGGRYLVGAADDAVGLGVTGVPFVAGLLWNDDEREYEVAGLAGRDG